MNITFLDAGSLGPGLDTALEAFSAWGTVVRWSETPLDQRAERLKDTVVAVANRAVFDEPLFLACPSLRLVLLTATGHNTVDLEAARRHSVAVCNVVGYSTESVAQHTLALLLSLMEQSHWLDNYARRHWPGSVSFGQFDRPFHEISSKKWGIIGMGAIGKRVADLAAALGASPSYFSVSGVDRMPQWPRVSLEVLLRESDILTLHSPLTPQTRGLLGTRELGWMKPSAYLVNVGRGGIVDETALARALDAGTLAGAALDVTLPEPPAPDHPLLSLNHPERLVLSPHVAWASVESRQRCLKEVVLNLEAWVQGTRRNRLD